MKISLLKSYALPDTLFDSNSMGTMVPWIAWLALHWYIVLQAIFSFIIIIIRALE